MRHKTKPLTLQFERIIPAPPAEVYDAWLDPKIPGNPWSEADKLLLDPRVDGFFYWLVGNTAHYGRFTQTERPARLQHTWVSPYTLGEESTVTLTFEPHAEGTKMTLVHSDLPEDEMARAHEKGWTHFMDLFPATLAARALGSQ